MQNKDRNLFLKFGGGGAGLASWDEIPIFPQYHVGRLPYDTVIRPTYLLPRTLTTSLAPLRTTLTEAKTTGNIELLKSPRDEANPKKREPWMIL